MKIILNEMKKTFNLKMVCLLLVLCAVLFIAFIKPNTSVSPSYKGNYRFEKMKDIIRNDGNNINENSLNELKNIYNNNVDRCNNINNNNKDLKNQGINSFDDYKIVLDKVLSGESSVDTINKVEQSLEKYDLEQLWNTAEIADIIKDYNNKGRITLPAYKDQKYVDRLNEISRDGENKSIFFSDILRQYSEVICSFGMCILIIISIALLPTFLRDKESGVYMLQYTSKQGRKLFAYKIASGVLSAVIIATIGLIICFVMYSSNDIGAFLGSNVNSAMGDVKLWISITFKGYIILTVFYIYILSIVTALITMFISSRANKYVTAIGVDALFIFVMSYLTCGQVVPVLGADNFLRAILLDTLFNINNPKYLVQIMYVVLVIVAVGLTLFAAKKEKKRDALN